MPNRYKTAKQSLPIAAWVIGCCVAACIVGFGLKFLTVKYQVFMGGKAVKEKEVRLSRLTTEIEGLQASIDRLSARPELMKKFNAGYLALRSIVETKDVVYLGRDDKHVEWKAGVAYVANRVPSSPGKNDEGGGSR